MSEIYVVVFQTGLQLELSEATVVCASLDATKAGLVASEVQGLLQEAREIRRSWAKLPTVEARSATQDAMQEHLTRILADIRKLVPTYEGDEDAIEYGGITLCVQTTLV